MKQYYVIRHGWNAANQSALCRPASPRNDFESGRMMLVGIVAAESADQAKAQFEGSCYANQVLSCETNPRAIRGLTSAIAKYRQQDAIASSVQNGGESCE
jgi:hypothetical protein